MSKSYSIHKCVRFPPSTLFHESDFMKFMLINMMIDLSNFLSVFAW